LYITLYSNKRRLTMMHRHIWIEHVLSQ